MSAVVSEESMRSVYRTIAWSMASGLIYESGCRPEVQIDDH